MRQLGKVVSCLMRANSSRQALARALCLSSLVALTACGEEAAPAVSNINAQRAMGVLEIELVVPELATNDVRYEITGKGIQRVGGMMSRVPSSSKAVAILDLPEGDEYLLVLETILTGGSICRDAATFDVTAEQTTTLDVRLPCGHSGLLDGGTSAHAAAVESYDASLRGPEATVRDGGIPSVKPGDGSLPGSPAPGMPSTPAPGATQDAGTGAPTTQDAGTGAPTTQDAGTGAPAKQDAGTGASKPDAGAGVPSGHDGCGCTNPDPVPPSDEEDSPEPGPMEDPEDDAEDPHPDQDDNDAGTSVGSDAAAEPGDSGSADGDSQEADAGSPDGDSQEGRDETCEACAQRECAEVHGTRRSECEQATGQMSSGPAGGQARAAVCAAALACAHDMSCVSANPLECYCGWDVDKQRCRSEPQGPCRAAYEAAGETSDPRRVLAQIRGNEDDDDDDDDDDDGESSVLSAVALLIACEAERCSEVCVD